jgi:WD40 repeat protein
VKFNMQALKTAYPHDPPRNFKRKESAFPKVVLKGHDSYVFTLAFSPDGKTVALGSIDKTMASGSGDKTARLWDAATGEERQKLEGHDDLVGAVAYSQSID